MRSSRFAGPFLAFVGAFAAYGCSLDVSGLDPSAGGASATSGQSSATGLGEGGISGPGCASSMEVCDDGKDNNCDGLIDCADPQCQGASSSRECVALAPTGWSVVAYAPGDTATCPAGYGGMTKVAEAPTSKDTQCACTCDCTGTANNPCVHGTLNVVIGGGCTATTLSVPVTGNCDAIGQKLGNYNSIKGTPLGVNPIDSAGNTTLPGMEPGASGVTCAPGQSAAGGCMAGQACLPKALSASLCIQRAGDVVCPPGPFTKRRVVGAPGLVNDQRSCAACTCSSSAASCSSPTFSGYTGNCGSAADLTAAVTKTCAQTMGSWDKDDHFIYAATPDAPTCAIKGAAPAVLGAITPQGAMTLCCAP